MFTATMKLLSTVSTWVSENGYDEEAVAVTEQTVTLHGQVQAALLPILL